MYASLGMNVGYVWDHNCNFDYEYSRNLRQKLKDVSRWDKQLSAYQFFCKTINFIDNWDNCIISG